MKPENQTRLFKIIKAETHQLPNKMLEVYNFYILKEFLGERVKKFNQAISGLVWRNGYSVNLTQIVLQTILGMLIKVSLEL